MLFYWFSLALNGGGRFLSPSSPLSSLLCSLVSWETLSALLSKLKYYGLTGLLMQLTPSKLGFRGTWLPWRRSQPAIRWRVGEVTNRVSGGSFRGGHWYLPIRNHDNRYFADWIRLCPGRIQKTGTAVQSPTRLPVWLKLWEERSALRQNYNRNMDSTKEKFTALQREID